MSAPPPAGEGLPAWAGIYAAFDEAALAALANRGLVRRARSQLATCRIALEEAGEERVVIAIGEPALRVVLGPAGPKEAHCPCPVAGACLHLVLACLWLGRAARPGTPPPETSAAPTPSGGGTGHSPPQEPADEEPTDSGPGPSRPEDLRAGAEGVDRLIAEVLGWEPTQVERALGAAARRRASAALAGRQPQDLAEGLRTAGTPDRLAVSWPGSPEVVIVRGTGPRGMIVAGRHSRDARATWCLQAVVRLHAGAGRPWPWQLESLVVSAAQRDTLEAVRATVETIVEAGISHAGARSAQELDRLGQRARLEQMPRLARLLASAGGRLHAVARRDDAVEESDALRGLSSCWSLAQALSMTTGAPDPVLLGAASAEETRPGLLMPLSARWWQSLTGARGLTMRLWDTERHRLESVTTGRAAGADPAFQRSERLVMLWSTSVAGLLSGPQRLTGAVRRPDGSLAPSTRTRAVREGRLEDVDMEAVAEGLAAAQRGLEAAAFEGRGPRCEVLLIDRGGLGRIDIDEVRQEYVWPVRGTGGQELVLALGPDSGEMEAVASIMARNLPVVALSVEGRRPTGVFVHLDGRLRLLAPTISEVQVRHWSFYSRLRRRLESLRSRARPAALDAPADPFMHLCQDLEEALAALAAGGVRAPQGATAQVLSSRTARAREMGLVTLTAALEQVQDSPDAAALLRASAILSRVRALSG